MEEHSLYQFTAGGRTYGAPEPIIDWPGMGVIETSRIHGYIGKPAPAIEATWWFNVPRANGTLANGKELRQIRRHMKNKVVLIDFWSTKCVPCVLGLSNLEQLWQQYRSDGLVVLGIHGHVDGAYDIEKVISEKQLTFPIAYDNYQPPQIRFGGATSNKYGINIIPQQVLIDRRGIVRSDISLEQVLKE